MERLTFEGHFCDIAKCVGEPGNTSECPGGYCDQRRVWERLKDYEDTGLTPEQVAVQQWVPVTERLPEHSDNVLVCVTDNFANVRLKGAFLLAAYCDEDGWILEMWPEMERPNVTHWMPLPKPPKGAIENDL